MSAATGVPGSAAAKSPRITVGEKRPRSPTAPERAGIGAAPSSGSLVTSRARARCGRRRMKPRSSRPLMSRWMPDFERNLSASFISSKDGAMPVAASR